MSTRASSFDDTRTLQQLPDAVELTQVQPSEKNVVDPFLVSLDPSEDPQVNFLELAFGPSNNVLLSSIGRCRINGL